MEKKKITEIILNLIKNFKNLTKSTDKDISEISKENIQILKEMKERINQSSMDDFKIFLENNILTIYRPGGYLDMFFPSYYFEKEEAEIIEKLIDELYKEGKKLFEKL